MKGKVLGSGNEKMASILTNLLPVEKYRQIPPNLWRAETEVQISHP
jgi:hypothetical protein